MNWLHAYACLLAVATVVLIAAGGMVTSTGSGLSVPDWPNSYGYFMFAFPLSNMVGGIFYEHGHRLIASIVGMLTIGLVIWLWLDEPRRWIRRLGVIALAAVVLQGLLGGLTVLYFLPTPISVSHAGVAQIFFCLTVCLALFTSRSWHDSGSQADLSIHRSQRVSRCCCICRFSSAPRCATRVADSLYQISLWSLEACCLRSGISELLFTLFTA